MGDKNALDAGIEFSIQMNKHLISDFSTADEKITREKIKKGIVAFFQLLELSQKTKEMPVLSSKQEQFVYSGLTGAISAAFTEGYIHAKNQIREAIGKAEPGERAAACEKALGDK